MPDYSKSKIYKLICDDPELVYYGSTTQKYLSSRLAGHKVIAKKGQCKSQKLIDAGGVKIYLVENFPCESKNELHARERFYIENNNCVNKALPGRTQKEYKNTNKKLLCEKAKINYHKNKKKILDYQKEKVECYICKKTFARQYLKPHIKRIHS